MKKDQKIKPLSDWEWDLTWSSLRYFCGRYSIASAMYPSDLVRNFGKRLSEDQKQFCIKERPDLDPVKVSAGFKDYWISAAGAKAVKKDWDATWRNWVRNQKAQLVVAAKPSGDWWMNDRRIK